MREGIHPEYYQATVTCNCGNTFVTGSTKKDIHVEICSKCHPVDVLTSSIKNTELTHKNIRQRDGLRLIKSQPVLS